TIAVTFAPKTGSAGGRTATVSVTANPGMTAMTGLSGSAQAGAQLTITAATAFAATVISQTNPTSQTLTVKNAGDVMSGIPTVSVTGTNAADFTTTNPCSAPPPLTATRTIAVTFAPKAGSTGTRSATVSATASPGGTAMTGL